MSQSLGFSAALGLTVKVIRKRHELTQDQIAAAAREFGIKWSRSSVASLECGGRELSASEFVLLPSVLSRATSTVVGMPDVVDALPANFLIGGGRDGSPEIIASLLNGGDLTVTRLPRPESDALLEAERKAGRALGIGGERVALLSHRLWGHGLTTERESRLANTKTPSDPRRRQASRGHITRRLLTELRNELR